MVTSNCFSRLDQPLVHFDPCRSARRRLKVEWHTLEKLDPRAECYAWLQKLQHEYDIVDPLQCTASRRRCRYYPRLGPNLRLDRLPVWYPRCRRFIRGLTAALVSGYFAGGECAGTSALITSPQITFPWLHCTSRRCSSTVRRGVSIRFDNERCQ